MAKEKINKFIPKCRNCNLIIAITLDDETIYKCKLLNTNFPSSNIIDINSKCSSYRLGKDIIRKGKK